MIRGTTDRVGPELRQVFVQLGGSEGCLKLSEAFHEAVCHEPNLRRHFPKSMDALTAHFALFLEQQFGGAKVYTARRGKQSLVCRHAHLTISTTEAQAWLACMSQALNEVGMEGSSRTVLDDFFANTAETLTDRFSHYYTLTLDELQAELDRSPDLIGQSPMGHSLLRSACERWELGKVRSLLERGADARMVEKLGHGLLYRVANCRRPGLAHDACEIVVLLVQHGADANLQSGPGRNSPLHMAARRGNVEIARALLACGANIECKDTKGETPLRRAVNCGNVEIANALVRSGADVHSKDRRGWSAKDSARSPEMREALTLRR